MNHRDTHATRAGDMDDRGEFRRSRDGMTWQPDPKCMAPGELTDQELNWQSWVRDADKAYDSGTWGCPA